MSPYAARPMAGTGGPTPAYRGTPLMLGGGLSPLGGGPLAAGNLALRGRAAKYAEVVKKLNAAGGVAQSFQAVQEFAAACADESNGAHAGGGVGGVGSSSLQTVCIRPCCSLIVFVFLIFSSHRPMPHRLLFCCPALQASGAPPCCVCGKC